MVTNRSAKRPYSRSFYVAAAIAVAGCGGGQDMAGSSASGGAMGGASDLAAATASAHDMRLVGMHDLQGRSAYQPVVHAYGDRRILFVGHHVGEAPNPLTGATEVTVA